MCRFSSGDLSSEIGGDEDVSGDSAIAAASGAVGNRPPPLQTQPVGTGPPNIPPPAGEPINNYVKND